MPITAETPPEISRRNFWCNQKFRKVLWENFLVSIVEWLIPYEWLSCLGWDGSLGFFYKKSLGLLLRFLASILINKMVERKTNGFGCQKLFYFLFFFYFSKAEQDIWQSLSSKYMLVLRCWSLKRIKQCMILKERLFHRDELVSYWGSCLVYKALINLASCSWLLKF